MTSAASSSSSSTPFEPAADLPGLDAARAAIAADLARTQGPARTAPWRTAFAVVVPVVVVIGGAFVALSALRGFGVAVVAAAVAAVLALVGVAIAPRRPGLGERFAQLAVPVAVAAFAAELWRMVPGGVAGAAACVTTTTTVAVLAGIGAVVGVWSSGLPLRAWHKAGVAVVAVVGACAAVWHHCRSDELGHVLIAHIAGPVLLMLVVFVVVGRRGASTTR